MEGAIIPSPPAGEGGPGEGRGRMRGRAGLAEKAAEPPVIPSSVGCADTFSRKGRRKPAPLPRHVPPLEPTPMQIAATPIMTPKTTRFGGAVSGLRAV